MRDYDPKAGQVLLTVKQLANHPNYPFSEAALRHLIFQSEPRYSSSGEIIAGNGLTSALVRVGRRIYVDIAAFDLWLNDHRLLS